MIIMPMGCRGQRNCTLYYQWTYSSSVQPIIEYPSLDFAMQPRRRLHNIIIGLPNNQFLDVNAHLVTCHTVVSHSQIIGSMVWGGGGGLIYLVAHAQTAVDIREYPNGSLLIFGQP